MSKKPSLVDHNKLIGSSIDIGSITIEPKNVSLYAVAIGFNRGND
jgi:hypothetical protein